MGVFSFVLGSIPFVLMALVVGYAVWLAVLTFGKPEAMPIVEFVEDFGTFRKFDDRWGCYNYRGSPLHVTATDRDSRPDPEFLVRFPDFLAALPEFLRLARAFEPELHEGYEAYGLVQGQDGEDFVLRLSDPEADDYLECLIGFANGRPVATRWEGE